MSANSNEVRHLNIVVVEDNPDDQELLSICLGGIADKSVECHFSETLHDGLTKIKDSSPTLIILDLSLPDSFGIDTLKSVRRKHPSIPIIVLTGMDDETTALECIDAGAQDYLIKGEINASLLRRSINYAIERQRIYTDSMWNSALVENVNYALIGLTTDGIISTWNLGAEEIFGYTASEMIGESISKLSWCGPDKTIDLFHLPNVRSSQNPVPVSQEANLLRKNGKNILVKIFISPIKDLDGDVTALSVLMRDISAERKTADDLRDSDERLNLATDAAKLGLWDWDIKTNELRLDARMSEILDITIAPRATIKQFFKKVHSADRKTMRNLFNKPGAFDVDFRVVSDSGQTRFVQMRGEIFCDESGAPARVTGVSLDISARKEAEEALRVSEETLKLALDASQMGVWEFSLADRVMARSVLHEGIFGHSNPPQWTARIFMDHVHPADKDEVRRALNNAVTEGSLNLKCRIINSDDKKIHWILLHAKRTVDAQYQARMIGTIKDITQSRELEILAEQAHERSNRILEAVVEYAPNGVAMLDSKLRIASVNAAFEEMVGKKAQGLIGTKLDHVFPYLQVKQACSSVLNGQPAQLSRLMVPTLNGMEKYWDLSVWPVKFSEHDSGAVLQLTDRTHTVLLERQRDDFVASVAHDIKNPLIGASRLLGILCNDAAQAPPERHESHLKALKDSTENLLSLVQNLVDVYRYETLTYPCHFERLETATLIESCVNQMSAFAENRSVSITTLIDEDAEFIDADAIGIRRVLMNLIHNAIKFNKPGGWVTVSVKKEKARTEITISDSGVGVSSKEQEQLFQRYVQGAEGKRRASGTGLGLYLSKQIISAHKGSINCRSISGKGTQFTVLLPHQKKGLAKGDKPLTLTTPA